MSNCKSLPKYALSVSLYLSICECVFCCQLFLPSHATRPFVLSIWQGSHVFGGPVYSLEELRVALRSSHKFCLLGDIFLGPQSSLDYLSSGRGADEVEAVVTTDTHMPHFFFFFSNLLASVSRYLYCMLHFVASFVCLCVCGLRISTTMPILKRNIFWPRLFPSWILACRSLPCSVTGRVTFLVWETGNRL